MSLKLLISQKGKIEHEQGVLCRRVEQIRCDCSELQLIFPKAYRQQAIQSCPDKLGHLGLERILDVLREKFYWPGLTIDTQKHIMNCPRCLCFKAKPSREELYHLLALYPLELVYMAFLMNQNPRGDKDINVLAITDHFTWYAKATVISSQTGCMTAQAFWNHFITEHRFPEKLLTDQRHNIGCHHFII